MKTKGTCKHCGVRVERFDYQPGEREGFWAHVPKRDAPYAYCKLTQAEPKPDRTIRL